MTSILRTDRPAPPADSIAPSAIRGADVPLRGRLPGADPAPGITSAPTSLGDRLNDTPPGPALARLLATIDPDHIDDADLVEAIAAAPRQESWTHATVAALAAELARRPAMNPVGTHTTDPVPDNGCVAGEELALRLGITRVGARSLIREGIAYDGPLAATGRALATGHLDPAKARLIADRLADLPYQVTDAVECAVLPGADRRTAPQLARDLEREIIVALGSRTDDVRDRARATRRVGRPRVLPDGMAALHCVLPDLDAARIDAVLDSCARTARNAGDPRTLDQLRADGLRDLVVGVRLPATATAASPTRADRGDVDPTGDTPAPACPPAAPVQVDLTRVRTTVHVTVALTTLLGIDDAPATLADLGPISAADARTLALDAGSTWRRLVTDPLSGAVVHVGRTRYRPPSALADHVRARDRSCVRPGCQVSADRCDLDHTVEFHTHAPGAPSDQRHLRGGTEPSNIGPLCRRDHRLKSTAGFVLRQIAPGVFEWTTPTGHRYRLIPGSDSAYTRLPTVRPGTPIDVITGRPRSDDSPRAVDPDEPPF